MCAGNFAPSSEHACFSKILFCHAPVLGIFRAHCRNWTRFHALFTIALARTEAAAEQSLFTGPLRFQLSDVLPSADSKLNLESSSSGETASLARRYIGAGGSHTAE